MFFFVIFVLFFVVVHVSPPKMYKKWVGEWVAGIWPIRVFLGFLDFFQLDKTPKHTFLRNNFDLSG